MPTRAPSTCSRAAAPPMSGCCRTSRSRETTLLPTPDRIAIHRADRRAAEPRRRQSVLARPLCRAHRGDAAAGAGAAQPRRPNADDGARTHDRAHRATCSAPGSAVPERHSQQPGRAWSRARRCSGDFDGALPSLVRRRARGGVGHPRPVLAGRLARADRPGRGDRRAAATGPSESAMFERVNGALRIIASFSGLAQENMTPARRLALPRARPPHRARARDLPLHPPVRRRARARRRARRAAGTLPTARSPTGCATSWWRRARR